MKKLCRMRMKNPQSSYVDIRHLKLLFIDSLTMYLRTECNDNSTNDEKTNET